MYNIPGLVIIICFNQLTRDPTKRTRHHQNIKTRRIWAIKASRSNERLQCPDFINSKKAYCHSIKRHQCNN